MGSTAGRHITVWLNAALLRRSAAMRAPSAWALAKPAAGVEPTTLLQAISSRRLSSQFATCMRRAQPLQDLAHRGLVWLRFYALQAASAASGFCGEQLGIQADLPGLVASPTRAPI